MPPRCPHGPGVCGYLSPPQVLTAWPSLREPPHPLALLPLRACVDPERRGELACPAPRHALLVCIYAVSLRLC